MIKRLLGLVLILVVASGSSPFVQGQANTGAVKRGGTLVAGIIGDPGHLQTGTTTGQNVGLVTRHIYETLLRYDFDFKLVPVLAQSWEISADSLTYTFRLIRNATWSDGTRLTSADVKFTFEQLTGKYHPRVSAMMQYVDSITTPDDYTVVFKMKSEYGPFFVFMTRSFQAGNIFPKHIWEKSVASMDDLMKNPATLKPVGSGPFVVGEWVKQDHITLVRNERYWRKDQPYLDKIIYKFIPASTTRALALESGDVDVLPDTQVPQSDIPRLIKNPKILVALKPAGDEGINPIVYCFMNTQRAPFDKVLVRQAIAYALDRNKMIDLATNGYALPVNGPYSINVPWAYAGDTPGVAKYTYDPNKANQLLDQAGYPRGADGTRFSTTWMYNPEDFDHMKIAEIARENLKAIGITVTPRPLESGTMDEVLWKKWDFDLAGSDLAGSPDPELGVRRVYDSTFATRQVFTGPTGYVNKDVDVLFDKAAKSVDLKVRGQYYRDAAKIIMNDMPVVQLYEKKQPVAMNKDVLNIPSTPLAYFMDNWATAGWREGPTAVTTTSSARTTTSTTPPPPPGADYTLYFGAALVALIVLGIGAYQYRKRKSRTS